MINTSFNMEEEPIVCTPCDAVREFLQAHLDGWAIGPYFVPNLRAEVQTSPGVRASGPPIPAAPGEGQSELAKDEYWVRVEQRRRKVQPRKDAVPETRPQRALLLGAVQRRGELIVP